MPNYKPRSIKSWNKMVRNGDYIYSIPDETIVLSGSIDIRFRLELIYPPFCFVLFCFVALSVLQSRDWIVFSTGWMIVKLIWIWILPMVSTWMMRMVGAVPTRPWLTTMSWWIFKWNAIKTPLLLRLFSSMDIYSPFVVDRMTSIHESINLSRENTSAPTMPCAALPILNFLYSYMERMVWCTFLNPCVINKANHPHQIHTYIDLTLDNELFLS